MVEGDWTELGSGEEFAGYRIERRLGRGGMGILYLAIEPGLERRVALKLIAPEAAADEVFAKRFAEESRIAASIEHPNVVPIYAAGEQAGVPYIAMRYVAGSDLGRRLATEGRLGREEAVGLIAQIGNGLDAIHAAGLVHRDVKPANVLLAGGEGEPHAYITDFGVARNVATESGLTQTGRFVGTLDYVAPEQISGGSVDARVDVYALGCLLFKLLTGQVPYPREGEAARLYAHLNDPPPAPSLYAPEVGMALDDVVARAMSKQPEDRYPSAGDLGRAAQAALTGAPISVPERTVATGAAASREESKPAATEPPTVGGGQSTAAEVAVPPAADEPPTPPTGRVAAAPDKRPRRAAIAGMVLALLVVAGVAIALVSSAGDGNDSTAGSGAPDTTAAKDVTSGEPSQPEQKPKPQPQSLTRAELVVKGDAICADSQAAYKRARDAFPNGEGEANVAYSKLLTEITSTANPRFRALDAPASIRATYREYVEAQERVGDYDKEALAAARQEDLSAYLAAREKRDNEAGQRYNLARAIGFETCSASST
ncbi:MAG: protein kinase [Solirubrobacterales bacterium]